VSTEITRPADGWPLIRAATELGVALPESVAESLARWLDLLVLWNKRVDLTAARSADELVDLMLADALVLSTHIDAAAHVVDVGTGAGAPGLALAILRPDLEVTLVEPLVKRRAFLRTVLGTLGLPRVNLDPRKGDVLATSQPRSWDVALARATLAPTPWLALARQLVTARGVAWVFLAKEPSPTNPGFIMGEELEYVWPLTQASRRLVRYERRVATRPPG
jgi:16S rRNA (guanine527-N7)-methyltransferase